VGGLSNSIFSYLLEFINQLLPTNDEALLDNTYKAKKFLSDMGLGYKKILVYQNDCMLFWKGNVELDSCTVCEKSKWFDEILDEYGQLTSSKRRLVEVLQFFPLIPRLQRLFMSQHTTLHMKWHANGHTKDRVFARFGREACIVLIYIYSKVGIRFKMDVVHINLEDTIIITWFSFHVLNINTDNTEKITVKNMG
jgi:hypothetical protein